MAARNTGERRHRLRYAAGQVRHHAGFLPRPTRPERSAVAVGDSLTAGHHHRPTRSAARDSWFDLLALSGDVDCLRNAGVGGNAVREILPRFESDVIALRPAVVFILAGTNDILRSYDPAETLDGIAVMVARSQAAGAVPFVGLLPPVDLWPDRVRNLNDQLRGYAADVPVVDFWSPLTDQSGRYAAGMSRDGLHPTHEAARRMAAAARDALVRTRR